MTGEIAGDNTAARRQSKTRKFYGFMGVTDYDEAFIEELSRDFEECGYDIGHIPLPLEEKIVVDPKIAHGRPVVLGSRVPVAVILGALARGMEIDETAREFGIEREDVQAAIGYAARIVSQEAI